MINHDGWIITLTALGFIILLLIVYELYMHYVINVCSIFKVNKYFDKHMITHLICLVINLIISVVLLFIHLADQTKGFLFYTLLFWTFSLFLIGLIPLRLIVVYHFNKVKLNPIVLHNIDPNQITKIYRINNEQKVLNYRFVNSNWKRYLSEDLVNLKQQIRAITKNYEQKDLSVVIANLVLFLEQYTISFFKKKRLYAVCVFKNLVNDFQTQLKKNNLHFGAI